MLAPEAFSPIAGGWGRQGWTVARLSLLSEADLCAALEIAWRNAQAAKRRRSK